MQVVSQTAAATGTECCHNVRVARRKSGEIACGVMLRRSSTLYVPEQPCAASAHIHRHLVCTLMRTWRKVSAVTP